MPAPKYPTMDEIQTRTVQEVDEARARQPRTWPLFPAAPYNGEVDGYLHCTQERMSSGDLDDAPDDGGPLPLGKGSAEMPFKGMKSGR